ncbi:MAG: ferritin-like domain-containing protein [Planctomycetia bacterium]
MDAARWIERFRGNDFTGDKEWAADPEWTDADRRRLGPSLAEFQLGESSEALWLFKTVDDYAARTGDAAYPQALRLFIGEEHRHCRVLGRFLDVNGVPRAKRTFNDGVFRRLRKLVGSLEGSLVVLATAEVVATVYYAALAEASAAPTLREICRRILCDEAHHVRFQAEQLARLRRRRGRWRLAATVVVQRTLFAGAVVAVWRVHGPVFRAAAWSFRRYWRSAWLEFHRFERRATPGRDGSELRPGGLADLSDSDHYTLKEPFPPTAEG